MSEPAFAIETTALSKRFGSTTVLHNLNLAVEVGEIYGFLGPNGAGKTTTISVLMDFIRPTSGKATLLGGDSRIDAVKLKQVVGYVPADPQLYPRLTGRDHIALYERIHHHVGAMGLADRLGLNLDVKARVLSTGNQQKLAFVLALSAKPKLLILDEPTRGLDPLAQDQVYAELRTFRDAGGTVFISSHNLAEVAKLCDRVGLIKAGTWSRASRSIHSEI
jgi:ABC-2 type transport system ATP-binding protein